MQKIRINDLARELEVKSKMILDALIKVGVTEKKTHSSSIEVDEAERVKKYFAQHPEPGATRASSRTSADEFKRKLDLSHISKPGDVLKAVTQRAAQPSAAARPATPPTLATPAGPRQTVAPPSAVRPASSVTKPVASVASPTLAPPAKAPKPAPRFITPQSVARPPAAIVIPPKPPVVAPPAPPVHLSSAAGTAQPSEPVIEDQITALEESGALPSTLATIESEIPTAAEGEVPAALLEAPPATEKRAATGRPAAPGQAAQGIVRPGLPTRSPGTAAHTPRRLIVPQTGPRPVYLAPPVAPPRPGAPIAPRGGMPERGKPIFQRPRPGVPPQGQTRPAVRPGERRGPHPTRSGAPGTRPGFGAGAGVAPPPPTGQRPAGRPARPGQRYVPRGVKEGPMKGFVPPPRLSLSSEPLPITRSITIPEGISVKDLAEKLGIRAKDLIARLLARGVFATVNQTLDSDLATDMGRHFGAETAVITFEEQLAKDTVPAEGTGEEGTAQGVVR